MTHNSKELSDDYKVMEVIQSWDSSGYIISREATKKMIKTNSKSWLIADDWVRYKRHAKVDIFNVIPPIIKQNTNLFDSNLMTSRNKAIKNRSLKYILSRLSYKIISDIKKYFWLIPFKGYVRNKDVWFFYVVSYKFVINYCNLVHILSSEFLFIFKKLSI